MGYHEQFKAGWNAQWSVDDNGITVGRDSYSWDQVASITMFNDPKTSLTNGVFQAVLGGKMKNLAYLTKDKARAREAFSFIKAKIREHELLRSGMSPEAVTAAADNLDRKRSLVIYRQDALDEILDIADQELPPDEVLYVALRGAFKEYLFCTDRMVYIFKRGYMTGHTFGGGGFKMPYSNITNAEVDYHLTTGYFELSSGGLQNKPLNYWDSKGNSPQKAPNAISITGTELKDLFEKATHFIMEKVAQEKTQTTVEPQGNTSLAAQIRELKELLDEGILTQEEFDAKKKQLLGV